MIKQLLSIDDVVLEEVKKLDYESARDKCAEEIRRHLYMFRKLKGIDYDNAIRNTLNEFVENSNLVVENMNRDMLCLKLYDDINMFGILTDFFNNSDGITDIVCEGIGPGNLRIYHGMKNEIAKDRNGNILYFKSVEEIESMINKLAYMDNKRLSSVKPNLRCKTPQGFRLTATDKSMCSPVVLPDKTTMRMPTFSIRFNSGVDISLNDMVHKYKSMHPTVERAVMALASCDNIKVIFSGVPGSGKTTLMRELLRELRSKIIVSLTGIPELDLWEYDKDGVSTRSFKEFEITEVDDGSNDMGKNTYANAYYTLLSTKTDIIVLSEIRSVEEINIMLKVGVSGQGLSSTMHGEDAVTTMERAIKDTMIAKKCNREEAMEEVYLSTNVIVGMYYCRLDDKIRLSYVSEFTKNYDDGKLRLVENKLFDYHVIDSEINPETGMIHGVFRKTGIPSERLQGYLNRSSVSKDDIALLMETASKTNPIVYSESWD